MVTGGGHGWKSEVGWISMCGSIFSHYAREAGALSQPDLCISSYRISFLSWRLRIPASRTPLTSISIQFNCNFCKSYPEQVISTCHEPERLFSLSLFKTKEAFWFVRGAPMDSSVRCERSLQKNPLNQPLNAHIKASVIWKCIKILIIGVLAFLGYDFYLFT